MAFALDAGIFAFNVESEPELHALSRSRRREGHDGPHRLPREPRCGRQAPITRSRPARRRTSSAFPSRPRPSLYRQATQLPGIQPAGIHMHIGSQITDLAPFAQRLRAAQGVGRRLCAPKASASSSSISAAGSASRTGTTNRRRRCRPTMPRLVNEAMGDLGRAASVRARTHDRRQRRNPRVAGALREDRAGKDLHHRGCSHERFDPTDALRGLSPRFCPSSNPAQTPNRVSPTWWDPCARPAITSLSRGPCRRSTRATSSPS